MQLANEFFLYFTTSCAEDQRLMIEYYRRLSEILRFEQLELLLFNWRIVFIQLCCSTVSNKYVVQSHQSVAIVFPETVYGFSAVHHAARNNTPIEALITSNPGCLDWIDPLGRTPLMIAFANQQLEIINIIVQKYLKVDGFLRELTNTSDFNGKTTFSYLLEALNELCELSESDRIEFPAEWAFYVNHVKSLWIGFSPTLQEEYLFYIFDMEHITKYLFELTPLLLSTLSNLKNNRLPTIFESALSVHNVPLLENFFNTFGKTIKFDLFAFEIASKDQFQIVLAYLDVFRRFIEYTAPQSIDEYMEQLRVHITAYLTITFKVTDTGNDKASGPSGLDRFFLETAKSIQKSGNSYFQGKTFAGAEGRAFNNAIHSVFNQVCDNVVINTARRAQIPRPKYFLGRFILLEPMEEIISIFQSLSEEVLMDSYDKQGKGYLHYVVLRKDLAILQWFAANKGGLFRTVTDELLLLVASTCREEFILEFNKAVNELVGECSTSEDISTKIFTQIKGKVIADKDGNDIYDYLCCNPNKFTFLLKCFQNGRDKTILSAFANGKFIENIPNARTPPPFGILGKVQQGFPAVQPREVWYYEAYNEKTYPLTNETASSLKAFFHGLDSDGFFAKMSQVLSTMLWTKSELNTIIQSLDTFNDFVCRLPFRPNELPFTFSILDNFISSTLRANNAAEFEKNTIPWIRNRLIFHLRREAIDVVVTKLQSMEKVQRKITASDPVTSLLLPNLDNALYEKTAVNQLEIIVNKVKSALHVWHFYITDESTTGRSYHYPTFSSSLTNIVQGNLTAAFLSLPKFIPYYDFLRSIALEGCGRYIHSYQRYLMISPIIWATLLLQFDKDGKSLLYYVVIRNEPNILQYFLSQLVSLQWKVLPSKQVIEVTSQGQNLLHLFMQLPTVEPLLSYSESSYFRSGELTARDSNHYTALDIAISIGAWNHIKVYLYLCNRKGVGCSELCSRGMFEAIYSYYQSLFQAKVDSETIRKNIHKMITLLKDHNAFQGLAADGNGSIFHCIYTHANRPFHEMIMNFFATSTNYSQEYVSNCFNAVDISGNYLGHIWIRMNQTLLSQQASSSNGYREQSLCAVTLFQDLVKYYKNWSAKDKDGNTLLHYLVTANHKCLVLTVYRELLQKKQISPISFGSLERNEKHFAPIHYLASCPQSLQSNHFFPVLFSTETNLHVARQNELLMDPTNLTPRDEDAKAYLQFIHEYVFIPKAWEMFIEVPIESSFISECVKGSLLQCSSVHRIYPIHLCAQNDYFPLIILDILITIAPRPSRKPNLLPGEIPSYLHVKDSKGYYPFHYARKRVNETMRVFVIIVLTKFDLEYANWSILCHQSRRDIIFDRDQLIAVGISIALIGTGAVILIVYSSPVLIIVGGGAVGAGFTGGYYAITASQFNWKDYAFHTSVGFVVGAIQSGVGILTAGADPFSQIYVQTVLGGALSGLQTYLNHGYYTNEWTSMTALTVTAKAVAIGAASSFVGGVVGSCVRSTAVYLNKSCMVSKIYTVCFEIGANTAAGGIIGYGIYAMETGDYSSTQAMTVAFQSASMSFLSSCVSVTIREMRNQKICFVKGTLVSTPRGFVPIETLSNPTEVYTYNEAEQCLEIQTTDHHFVNQTRNLIELHVQRNDPLCVDRDPIIIKTTSDHPFYVSNQGWISAKYLCPGDLLLSFANKQQEKELLKIILVQNIVLDSMEFVYNLSVPTHRNYLITDRNILVHNSCSQEYQTLEQKRKRLNIQYHSLEEQSVQAKKRGEWDAAYNYSKQAVQLRAEAIKITLRMNEIQPSNVDMSKDRTHVEQLQNRTIYREDCWRNVVHYMCGFDDRFCANNSPPPNARK